MANKSDCINFRDYVDNLPEDIPQSILKHQESCLLCRQYFQVKNNIHKSFRENEQVNLWGEFRSRLATRDLQNVHAHKHTPFFRLKFAGAVGALTALIAIFSFMLVRAPVSKAQYSSLTASNYTQVSDTTDAEYRSEMNDLEYYYEISNEI